MQLQVGLSVAAVVASGLGRRSARRAPGIGADTDNRPKWHPNVSGQVCFCPRTIRCSCDGRSAPRRRWSSRCLSPARQCAANHSQAPIAVEPNRLSGTHRDERSGPSCAACDPYHALGCVAPGGCSSLPGASRLTFVARAASPAPAPAAVRRSTGGPPGKGHLRCWDRRLPASVPYRVRNWVVACRCTA
jgi:hypothetical protein